MKKIKMDILAKSKGRTFIFLFNYFQQSYGCIEDNPRIKDLFLDFIVELMDKGELRLAYKGEYLIGSHREQVDTLKKAWPTHYNEDDPLFDIDNLWWYAYAPAGPVWIYENGDLIWECPA
ncbi:hypothetical protein SAMN05660772_02294 [Pasteurella testudinis DSM 23072]|uniref:DUF596 domain-containing protein n=1 Tax=Pasteurella testudinis DSM 23072 TaxID=1122938 RepID=A0A1W1UUT1_9PAST|nr:DUF596 domain-containing protein [Pasteurella testudinis]SMB84474.1 hypothetical protein SAMN05660772_02294 [Pasteurella testudinis DSM 23072]SUB50420.1 Uncharacterized protein conserved in bacteria [Pasteurella testudinis]